MYSETQPTPHRYLNQYRYRVIVAGSRDYTDYAFFERAIDDIVSTYKLTPHNTIFISGKARGPDAMIIRWCRAHDFPWAEFPADWETHGRAAGHIRNAEMADVATNLIAFWDTQSPGTRGMIRVARKKGLDVFTILVDIDKKDKDYGWESESGRSRDTEIHRKASPGFAKHRTVSDYVCSDE